MNTQQTKPSPISTCEQFVKQQLQNAEGGHDWHHVHRVRNIALHIAERENANLLTVELAALLHDIADSKFHDGDEQIGPERARRFLETQPVKSSQLEDIVDIIRKVSFKGGHEDQDAKSIELQVVQDADRLDAMGAIGIARTFNFGGYKGNPLYDPEQPPRPGMSKAEYKKANSPTINHFYEKLLLLKDRMNTDFGRKLAEDRHRFMEDYLRQFYSEWEGKH